MLVSSVCFCLSHIVYIPESVYLSTLVCLSVSCINLVVLLFSCPLPCFNLFIFSFSVCICLFFQLSVFCCLISLFWPWTVFLPTLIFWIALVWRIIWFWPCFWTSLCLRPINPVSPPPLTFGLHLVPPLHLHLDACCFSITLLHLQVNYLLQVNYYF